ncbi:MAG TPA: right-handed parallel beta-helix repeat-containing protein [Roseiflexaceae bacterium]|nr:right-handed parallel beta-helix repeat-containing protein [Roseiflexaceae bacterium]
MQPRKQDDGDHTPGRAAAWDVVDDGANAQPAPTAAGLATAATDCLGWPTRRIRYTSDGVIHLEGCGQTFVLSDIPAAGIGADKLEQVDPANKIWLLKVKLKVEEGATLHVAGGASGDAGWLRLRSDSAGGIWLRADNGNLIFQDTKVTSWNPAIGAPDSDTTVAANGSGGRSYIAVRSVLTKGRSTAAPTACDVDGGSQEPYEARMSVVNSEIGYLGYDAAESYGVVWKVYYKPNPADPSDAPPPGRQLYAMVDVFGGASGSTFHHNYFGSYTFGGYCMSWSGNTFANNLQYGLDPHDDSDYLTISGNTFRDNGNHGVICSVECDHLVITNNQSYGNEHGIMVHRNSNGALIEGNTSRDNRAAGIAIFDSHDAIVRNNIVANNGEAAIRLSVGSSRNLIENNTLTGLAAGGAGPGYVIYTYKGSDPPTSGDGLPKANTFRGNRLSGYKSPLMKLGETTGNVFEANTIAGPATDMAFSQATGNIVRNSELGGSFQITLDASSAATLHDTRNAVWLLSRAGLGATVDSNGSTLNLTSTNAGPSVTVTTLDLTIKPQNGAITVLPSAWSASGRRWSESASTAAGPIAHLAGGLTAGGCFGVTANGASIGAFKADSSGLIAFSSSGKSGTVNFAIDPSSQCGAATPAPGIRLPLILRFVAT